MVKGLCFGVPCRIKIWIKMGKDVTFLGEMSLDIRQVPFMGQNLMAVQDSDGVVWVGVRWVAEGIGLNVNQARRERKRICGDDAFSDGRSYFDLPTDGGVQRVLCLEIRYVPLWLGKIRITNYVKRENPELADRLKQYQLEVRDVLAKAFVPQCVSDAQKTMPFDQNVLETLSRTPIERMPVVLHYLRACGYNVGTYEEIYGRLPGETVGVNPSANPVLEFADEVVANVGWGLLPFKIAYGMYKSWLRGTRPGTPCMGRNRFITELVRLADAGAIPGWRCPGRDVSVRPKGLMDGPESMLARYPVDPGLLVRRLTYNGLTRI